MRFVIELARRAQKDLDSLDASIAERIVETLTDYEKHENPMSSAKPLTGPLRGFFRFRIGSYRAIFKRQTDGKISILSILHIGHRKDVYE